jgi:hypothetical protein
MDAKREQAKTSITYNNTEVFYIEIDHYFHDSNVRQIVRTPTMDSDIYTMLWSGFVFKTTNEKIHSFEWKPVQTRYSAYEMDARLGILCTITTNNIVRCWNNNEPSIIKHFPFGQILGIRIVSVSEVVVVTMDYKLWHLNKHEIWQRKPGIVVDIYNDQNNFFSVHHDDGKDVILITEDKIHLFKEELIILPRKINITIAKHLANRREFYRNGKIELPGHPHIPLKWL